jgi:hypothetical protein
MLSPGRELSPHGKRPRPFGGVLRLRFFRVTFTYRKRPGPLVLFRACLFSLDSFVESAGSRPMALSCSHPSGSKPGRGDRDPRTRPHPDSSGPEQRQYRTRFKRKPIPKDGPDTPVTGLAGPSRQTFVTPDAGERECEGPKSFRHLPEGGGGRPITPGGLSQPRRQDRPPPRFAHPNTRVTSKFSCRFIM